ncbi:MAG: NADH-quinone oxidoreductase subunit J [Bacteroidales bacterium]|nr:NADH-quinone oxidoreductase subunit J [Bacteroidales bacterium]MDE6237701.1 NADH-quinone oxidoreductase subunit J [Muribaculaceae bacterium]MDE6537279.1 NADH-quinone oxidoreductase subunit J [Muribaculaceae bacterium]MDE6836127.1 NADH-quinone oxidoreductase subunit J [Muribaculaceae bacterium]
MESVANIILYFIVAIAMVVFSVMAVTTRKILRSATYLLFVLLSTAIFYFQLGYQFLGAVQIAVYAGGIMVLFVFSILLTRRPDEKESVLTHHKRAIGITVSVVSLVVLLFALFNMPLLHGASLTEMINAGEQITMHEIGTALVGSEKFQYLLPFEAVSVLLLACIIGGVVVARKR